MGPLGLSILHHSTKFGEIMLIEAKIQDGGRPPSWICYVIISDHPQSLFIGLLNFMLIRCIVLKIWRFDFLQIWLEMPIHAPKILVFWGSELLNVIGHHRDPKKAHPWPKPHLHAKFGADRSTGATWARAEGIKKERKKKRKKGEERNFFWRRFPIDFGQWLI